MTEVYTIQCTPTLYDLAGAIENKSINGIFGYKSGEARLQRLAVRLLLEMMLNERGLSGLKIVKNGYGKPYFEENTGLYFNFSHSGEYALCALSDKEVGADIERISEKPLRAAKRFMKVRELEKLSSLNECEKAEFATRLWTKKESVLKFAGEGITALNAVDIKDSTALFCGRVLILHNRISDGYSICVASEEKEEPIFSEITSGELYKRLQRII